MDRLISEQAVLDVINEAIRLGRFYSGKEQTIAEIKAIPSAEPSDVLNKIRAEIDKESHMHDDGEIYIKNFDVKRIIDRYREDKQDETDN